LSSRREDSQGNSMEETEEFGFGWIDLAKQFEAAENGGDSGSATHVAEILSIKTGVTSFDEHGDLPHDALSSTEQAELKVKITTTCFGDMNGAGRKRMLLYKHDDDLRQEAFAIQFVKTCDQLLKASGLDLKLLTFQCIPVGTKRGFVEWVPGSVPLSEICQPFAGSILGGVKSADHPSMFKKAGLTKYESLRRLGGQQNESLRRIGGNIGSRGSFANNPVQDYLRGCAYDPEAPFLIRKDVMDSYVKSCAGYSVITYILGVGDRHLDNLLLHQSGSFFHCDYSFILGSDPKTYLPVRVTEDMVFGMGGAESDNYARFLSMVGAAYLSLRRPENARILLSLVRLMAFSCIPDISEKQTTVEAITGLRDRLRLDLSPMEAVAHIEGLVESSQSSKMWIAVDAIHSLGKSFQ
jgi:phosphatidylinositol 3-kinase